MRAAGADFFETRMGRGPVSRFRYCGAWGRLVGFRAFLPLLVQLAGASFLLSDLDTLRTHLQTADAYIGRGSLLLRILPLLREGLFAIKKWAKRNIDKKKEEIKGYDAPCGGGCVFTGEIISPRCLLFLEEGVFAKNGRNERSMRNSTLRRTWRRGLCLPRLLALILFVALVFFIVIVFGSVRFEGGLFPAGPQAPWSAAFALATVASALARLVERIDMENDDVGVEVRSEEEARLEPDDVNHIKSIT